MIKAAFLFPSRARPRGKFDKFPLRSRIFGHGREEIIIAGACFLAEAELVHGGGKLAGALNRGALNAVLFADLQLRLRLVGFRSGHRRSLPAVIGFILRLVVAPPRE